MWQVESTHNVAKKPTSTKQVRKLLKAVISFASIVVTVIDYYLIKKKLELLKLGVLQLFQNTQHSQSTKTN